MCLTPPSSAVGYYANTRPEIVSALPRPVGRVLDVGCGEGALAEGLRTAGATGLTGVEPVAVAADKARKRYDDVVEMTIEDALDRLEGPFDTVLCLDVLEHLIDPATVVSRLAGLTKVGGRLQVSVPNARHISLVTDLLFRGTFGYTEWGHRDSTHLRWFTRADMVDLLSGSGWRVKRVSHPPLGRSRGLDRLTRGWSTQFLVGQLYFLAERA